MRLGLALLAWLLVLPAVTFAQISGGPPDPNTLTATFEPGALRTYGLTAKTFMTLSIADFAPFASAVTFQRNSVQIGHTISRTDTSGQGFFQAPLHLPEGALVTEIEAVFCDTNPSKHFAATLIVQTRQSGAPIYSGPSSSDAEAPGCVDRTVVFGQPLLIDNNNNSYYAVVEMTASDTTIQFSSMRIGYLLEVSPAPATATFTDVPTSDGAFRYIEALVAAGITTGCNASPPMYCPDDFVTRRQMAVFLSKALGLSFAP